MSGTCRPVGWRLQGGLSDSFQPASKCRYLLPFFGKRTSAWRKLRGLLGNKAGGESHCGSNQTHSLGWNGFDQQWYDWSLYWFYLRLRKRLIKRKPALSSIRELQHQPKVVLCSSQINIWSCVTSGLDFPCGPWVLTIFSLIISVLPWGSSLRNQRVKTIAPPSHAPIPAEHRRNATLLPENIQVKKKIEKHCNYPTVAQTKKKSNWKTNEFPLLQSLSPRISCLFEGPAPIFGNPISFFFSNRLQIWFCSVVTRPQLQMKSQRNYVIIQNNLCWYSTRQRWMFSRHESCKNHRRIRL